MTAAGDRAFAAEWLALRESADAEARATEPLALLGEHSRVIADLGCGTGSLGRWLAPRLPGPQHWMLFDRDPELLALARQTLPGVTVQTAVRDLGALGAADLGDCTLVVASALLDVLTARETDALAQAVAAAGCPALFSLSVVGRVELSPAAPEDAQFTAAFNAHQRRGGRLGPDAVPFACDAFRRLGAGVRTFPSPWRLGPDRAGLTEAWLRGWVGAAVEQEPGLAGHAYLERRLAQCAAAELSVTVHHSDLLVLPADVWSGARPGQACTQEGKGDLPKPYRVRSY